MKSALQFCSRAVNPLSPQPTAGMVKVSDGAMWSYGGTTCVRVPVPYTIDAAFNPAAVLPFFRKERKTLTVTVAKNRLVLKDGKEQLSTRCLPPADMVVLDVLSDPVPCGLDLKALKVVSSVVDPSNARLSTQGVQFRDGTLQGTDNRRLVMAASGLPKNMAFNLPLDTVKVLLKAPSPVTGVALEESAVKFVLEDGSSVCSNLIWEDLPDLLHLFKQEGWTKVSVGKELWAELFSIPCDTVILDGGKLCYVFEDGQGVADSVGEFAVPEKKIRFKLRKSFLDTLLTVSPDIRISDSGKLLQAFGKTSRCIAGVMHLP